MSVGQRDRDPAGEQRPPQRRDLGRQAHRLRILDVQGHAGNLPWRGGGPLTSGAAPALPPTTRSTPARSARLVTSPSPAARRASSAAGAWPSPTSISTQPPGSRCPAPRPRCGRWPPARGARHEGLGRLERQLRRGRGQVGLRQVGRVGGDHGEAPAGDRGEAVRAQPLDLQAQACAVLVRRLQGLRASVPGRSPAARRPRRPGRAQRPRCRSPSDQAAPAGATSSAHSTSVSVSGRGTSTHGPTLRLIRRKARSPVR